MIERNHEACCVEKGGTCPPCTKGKHHLCSGCHGCGCVISAQAGHHAHGYPVVKK